jgi:hypothetical protein
MTVAAQDDKVVTVQQSATGKLQRFNVANLKRYLTPMVPGQTPHSPPAGSPTPALQYICLTEVLPPQDARGSSPEFLRAKLAELEELRANGTWEEVWKHGVPPKSNIMRGRCVLSIKNKGTDEEVLKARFVAQG